MGAYFFEKNKLFYKKVLTNIYFYSKIYTEDKEREILNTRKGKTMTVKVKGYKETKYTAKKTAFEVKYEDVTKFEVKQIPRDEEVIK